MAVFGIREYDRLAVDANGNEIPVGLEPAIATQTVATSGASAASSAFNAKTRYIMINASGIVNWVVDGTAVVGGAGRLDAGVYHFMGVQSGGRDDAGNRTPLTISAIDDT